MNPIKLLPLGCVLAFGCIIPESDQEGSMPVSADAMALIDPPEVQVDEPLPGGVTPEPTATPKYVKASPRSQEVLASARIPSRATIRAKPRPTWMQTSMLFGSSELGPVEANQPARGAAHFYGTPRDAQMHLRVTGMVTGLYGAYIGKDCKPAAALHDNNPFDTKGVGSVTVRPNEIKIGTVAVDGDGVGELDAAIPFAYADLPPLTQRAIILMPATAEKVDQPQTKAACGLIQSVR